MANNAFTEFINSFVNSFSPKNQNGTRKQWLYYDEYNGARPKMYLDNSLLDSIYTKIANDVSNIEIHHITTAGNGKFEDYMHDGLEKCLTRSANINQTSTSFIQDIVFRMLEHDVAVVIPTCYDLAKDDRYQDIFELCCGDIEEWYPSAVKTNVYNPATGKTETLIIPKNKVAIIENPFRYVMGRLNPASSQLNAKLRELDSRTGSNNGKLNMLVQMPYSTRGELRANAAKERIAALNDQLENSPYGIGYIDSSESIIQLNRPLDPNIMNELEYLTRQVFSRIGLTENVINGTASNAEMSNYSTRVVELIASRIAEEFTRKFLSEEKIESGERIVSIKNPFRSVPATDIVTMSDTLSKNQILTPNEIRQLLGFKPSEDPNADILRNNTLVQDPEKQEYATPINDVHNTAEKGELNEEAV